MADVKGSEVAMAPAEWVEPEVTELSVAETEGFPGVGGDGSLAGPDCTRS